VKLTLQNIQADAAETVDVGVVDLGQETDFGRGHRIVVGQEQLKTEDATCKKENKLMSVGDENE
jgi:hypothetical protein